MLLDASVLARRLGFTFTYYRRATTDALVWRPLPPSLGLTSGRFENLVIQSPAFQVWPAIYDLYATNASLPPALDIYMEAGTIHDGSGGSTMQGILAAAGFDYTFEQVHEGHSWGHWRGKLDDAFAGLLGPR